MAGSFGDFLEDELLDHVIGNEAYTAPSTLYFALFTTAPNDDASGTEVSAGGYARKGITNNSTNFPASSSGSKTNNTIISFNQATASWGTVTHFAIFDALTSGNMLLWGELSSSKAINSGDTASFAASSLTFSLT